MAVNSISMVAIEKEKKLAISFRLLLGLYLIVPLCVLLQIIDGYLLGNKILQHLPVRPENYLLFLMISGIPHILASTLIMVTNGEYLRYYRIRIIIMTVLLAVFFGIGSLFLNYYIFYIFVASWTVFHVLKQQHGIARGVCRLPTHAFHLLLWLSVLAGIFIYIGVFLKNSLDSQQTEWIRHISASFSALLVVATLFCQRYVATGFGKLFLWANSMLVVSSYYFYMQGYFFLSILAPRLVHDTTAYVFYIAHDYNRHHRNPQNFLYRYANSFKLNIFIVLPVLSFSLAFLLQAYGDNFINFLTEWLAGVEFHKAITLVVLGYFALMHYYTEAFTWKNDSPYRKYIFFTK